MKVGIAQLNSNDSIQDNLNQIKKIILDAQKEKPELIIFPENSLFFRIDQAASVQAIVPRALVAAAFHHLPARELGQITDPIESDVLICSDHQKATEVTSEIVSRIPGCRPLDTGGLSNAAPVEAFAAVLLQLNVRYKTRSALRMTGIEIK